MKTVSIPFTSYDESIPEALDQIGAASVLEKQSHILIKPNLINAAPHPVTTPAACCEALLRYIRKYSEAVVVIAEGCGIPEMTTDEVFVKLGYADLARRREVTLVDLNTAPLRKVSNPGNLRYPTMMLPEIAFTHYLISVPVLKAHSLADITGALKNMMGLLPPRYYGHNGSTWRKAVFHDDLHHGIRDLNTCRPPDPSVMDASVGLAAYHLGGPCCTPPAATIIAGGDPWEVDRRAAGLLGLYWRQIHHLKGPSDQAKGGRCSLAGRDRQSDRSRQGPDGGR
jgi:uncharacterized protein (DUF362 family)